MNSLTKKMLVLGLGLALAGIATVTAVLITFSSNLPNLVTVQDYEPLLVSEVYARGGEKIGQFFREQRTLVPYEKIPQSVIHAFVAAEDAQFFSHHGINLTSILRAAIANLKAGRRVQGASTITQQVARSLMLTPEKSYVRKIKEMILAYRMETHMSKQDIIYLYLNQIYFGQGAYGIAMAAETYFRKSLANLDLSEIAILAGLPQAPSRYSPVYNPRDAKRRQLYVLSRMAEDGYITPQQEQEAGRKNVTVYERRNFKEIAPYYLETIRQLLVAELGEKKVLDEGLQIYTGLDFEQQIAANEKVQEGLRELDKRQGYRGAKRKLENPKEIAEFLLKTRDSLIEELSPERTILPDGNNPKKPELKLPELPEIAMKTEGDEKISPVPSYIKVGDIVEGVVIEVNDELGLVKVRFAEGLGMIDFDSMKWARKPNPEAYYLYDKIRKPSAALKKGDVIDVRVVGKQFSANRLAQKVDTPKFERWAQLELEQEPEAEAALLSFDQNTSEILAMVGGYDFARSEFNRAIQSARQTGSAFKAIVYAAALDKNYTPATPITDAPIVYEEEIDASTGSEDDEKTIRRWKPTNHGGHIYGDILFRNALIRSLNVPTVKILQGIGIDWTADYARRLGIFSPLNMDYTLGLGSSSITLYEMTKVFSQFGRLGRRIRPLLIHQVLSNSGKVLIENISLDKRFEQEIAVYDQGFEKRRKAYLEMEALKDQERKIEEAEIEAANQDDGGSLEKVAEENGTAAKHPPKTPLIFHEDPEQLIRPQTAYLITSLLQAAVQEGTGRRAAALGRPTAAKTGSTSGYFDGWFIGYTPQVATGVWVGFDQERSLGRLEVGGRNALPIWLGYMQEAHKGLAEKSFSVPADIIFANIDNETGKLASVNTKNYVRQAFIDGTEPKETEDTFEPEDETNFYKEDLSE